MQKRTTTLLCAVSMTVSVQIHAVALKVRPNAPQRYVVKQGDTLWSISGKYLYSPWQWNRLWGANRSDVRNPHMTYPEQVLLLHYVNGQPRLDFESSSFNSNGIPVIKLHPHIREASSGYDIQTVNVNFYRIFMQYPQIIDQMKTQNTPKLIEGPGNRLMYSKGECVYVYGITEPGRYLVYRATKDITDPDMYRYLGQEVVFSGVVSTLPYTNNALETASDEGKEYLKEGECYARIHPLAKVFTQTVQPMMVEEAVSEIRKGDFLLKMTDEGRSFQIMPHTPTRHISAKVVSIFDGVNEAGRFQTIALNKGEANGLDKGTVLSLYKRGRRVKVDLENGKEGNKSVVKYVSIPAEEVGLAMVYRTGEHLAFIIILESLTSVDIGDTASEPGHNLDNMAGGKPHVHNEPQNLHDTRNNGYNFRNDTSLY